MPAYKRLDVPLYLRYLIWQWESQSLDTKEKLKSLGFEVGVAFSKREGWFFDRDRDRSYISVGGFSVSKPSLVREFKNRLKALDYKPLTDDVKEAIRTLIFRGCCPKECYKMLYEDHAYRQKISMRRERNLLASRKVKEVICINSESHLRFL